MWFENVQKEEERLLYVASDPFLRDRAGRTARPCHVGDAHVCRPAHSIVVEIEQPADARSGSKHVRRYRAAGRVPGALEHRRNRVESAAVERVPEIVADL